MKRLKCALLVHVVSKITILVSRYFLYRSHSRLHRTQTNISMNCLINHMNNRLFDCASVQSPFPILKQFRLITEIGFFLKACLSILWQIERTKVNKNWKQLPEVKLIYINSITFHYQKFTLNISILGDFWINYFLKILKKAALYQ